MENHKEKLTISIEEYWQRDLPKVNEREIDLKLKSDLISDVIGPRRSGKTYLMFGGFPEVVLAESSKEDIVQTLFIDIISRDVISRIKKKTEIIDGLSYFLSSNITKPISFSKMCKMMNSRGFKISVPTLERYFFIMKEVFLFFDLTIFSYSVKDQLQYPRKIYSMDLGFTNLSGFRFSEDIGRFMENLAAVELLRKKSLDPMLEIYYWKDYQHKEVDFVLKKGLAIEQLIQVTYASNREEIAKREIKALIKAGKELQCSELLIITWDYESNDGDIRYLPLWKWLLRPS